MYKHNSVLKEEVFEWLDPRPSQNFIDCTLGRGGHTLEFLKRVSPDGTVMGIDLDKEAISNVKLKIKDLKNNNLILVQDNFKNLEKIYQKYFKNLPVDGILLDLGASSPQFDDAQRGFSFRNNGPLDMNFDQDGELKASEIINKWPKEELVRIFRDYGEEKFATVIAKNIILERESLEINNTEHLVEIVKNSIPFKVKNKSKINPATKIFQALRIEVNDELNNLKKILPQAFKVLRPRGRLAVISFHSLEDRIVKQFFVQESKDCVCPPSFPICSCSKKKVLKVLTRKPIVASEQEVAINPRSRSAKLRVAEKV